MNIVIVDDSINNDLSKMLKMISSELPFAIKIDSYADSFTFLDFILKKHTYDTRSHYPNKQEPKAHIFQ